MAKIESAKIGILGGSFDPAHRGHLKISNIALKKFKLKKIYWIITKKNPFKTKTFFSIKERIKYAKNIVKKSKNIEVIYIDDKIKSSKSIKVIQYILKNKKPKDLYFIVGTDILLNFQKWYNWKRIVKLAKLIVFSRKGYDKKNINTIVIRYLKKNNVIFVKNKLIQVSSSSLKKRVRTPN